LIDLRNKDQNEESHYVLTKYHKTVAHAEKIIEKGINGMGKGIVREEKWENLNLAHTTSPISSNTKKGKKLLESKNRFLIGYKVAGMKKSLLLE